MKDNKILECKALQLSVAGLFMNDYEKMVCVMSILLICPKCHTKYNIVYAITIHGSYKSMEANKAR